LNVIADGAKYPDHLFVEMAAVHGIAVALPLGKQGTDIASTMRQLLT